MSAPRPSHRRPGSAASRAAAHRRRGPVAPGAVPRVWAVALAVVVAVTSVLALPGPAPAAPGGAPPALAAPVDPDPGAPGAHSVDELSYDLGDQAFRPDGFPAPVEVKGKVYAPATISGRAPLVVLLHGRHATCAAGDDVSLEWPCPAVRPEIPSYQGYDALGRLLASHGAIVVSIGGNGVNAVDGYTADGGAAARAQLVLEHLRRWQGWDTSASGPFGSRFVGHVDLDRVGLMGHSRGGEGVVAAAQLNQRLGTPFGIAGVVALAPVDFARRVLGGVPLQVVLPFCDGDVSDLQGASYYDDGRYGTPGDTSVLQTTLLYGANHNFFNTAWTTGPGSGDDSEYLFFDGQPPADEPCRPEGPNRLTGPQQAAAGATIMGGFLRRFVFEDLALQPFVTGVAAIPPSAGPARWAVAHHGGDRLELARWASGGDARLGRHDLPGAVTAATTGMVCQPTQGFGEGEVLPCPGWAQVPGGTGVLDVGWIAPTASARADLPPAGVDVTGYDGIRFRVAFPADSRNDRRDRQDASVRVTDATGASATVAIGEMSPAFARRPDSVVRHAVLNGVRVPLSAFTGVDLTAVRSVEVRFDRTPSGRALVNDLAFTAEGTGDRVGPPAGAAPSGPIAEPCTVSAAARWACAVATTAWGREATAGLELNGIARARGSATARSSRMAAIVDGPTAGVAALGRPVQILLGDGYFQGELRFILAASGRRWEAALLRAVDLTPGSSGSTTTTAGVVEAVFVALVGRLPDPAARAYWEAQVEANGPGRLARTLMASVEWADRVVTGRFLQVVGRTPDAAARAYWRTRVRQPRGEQTLMATLLASEELVQRMARPGS